MDGMEEFLEEFDLSYVHYGDLDYRSRYEEDDDSDDIDHMLRLVYHTFKSCKIPVGEDSSKADPRCVKAFKYLLLNTKFKCLKHLARDPINGHLVKRCYPKMYRYILTEIVWYLEYEEILAESLLHMPLDLCIEILQILKRTIFLLDFERGLNLVVEIILNCHKNLIVAWKIGTQSINLEKNLENLMIHAQKFMAFLSNPKFLRLNEVKDLQKSERIGFVLKKIIALTHKCLAGNDNDSLPPEVAENYRLKFGEDPLHRSNLNFAPHLRMLNQEFIHILLKKLSEIDTGCYDSWAKLEADGNTSVSLQLSIRNDFYHFIEFLEVHRSFTSQECLIERLRKFNPQPLDTIPVINLDGFHCESVEMKIATIKSVINRYSDWNHDTFYFIRKNRTLLDSDDISYLIDYLVMIMNKPGQEDHKRRVCVTIRKALFQQRILDDSEMESNDSSPEYVKDDNLDCLNAAYSEDNFKNFIYADQDLKSPENLRTTLSYLLNNTRDVLGILIKVIIGVPDYAHLSICPEDLIFFYPAINLGESDMRLVLFEILVAVIGCDKWDGIKFANLVDVMLKEYKFTANQFVNDVFAAWLSQKQKDISTVVPMMKCVQKLMHKCTTDIKISKVAFAFAARLADYRKDLLLPRTVSAEIIREINCTAYYFLHLWSLYFSQYILPLIKIKNNYLLSLLEPIDRFQSPFCVLWRHQDYVMMLESCMLDDLAYHCLLGIQKAALKVGQAIPINPDAPTDISDFKHLKDDFVRYKLIKSSERELVKFAASLVYFNWRMHDFRDCYEAYDYFVRLSIETAIYFLEFPANNPPESFACLIRSLVRATSQFVNDKLRCFNNFYNGKFDTEGLRKTYGSYESMRNNFEALEECIKHSTFYPLYESMMAIMNDPALDEEPRDVVFYKILNAVEKFGDECLGIPHSEVRFDGTPSEKALRFKTAHDFINECLNAKYSRIQDESQYHSLCQTFKLLRSPETL